MTKAEQTRVRRAVAVAAGLCQCCCTRKPQHGLKTCERCLNRTYLAPQGEFNVCCQRSVHHRWDCLESEIREQAVRGVA